MPTTLLCLNLCASDRHVTPVTQSLAQVKTTLLVSLAWMLFNMIPPYLLLHYQFIGRGTTLKIVCKCAADSQYNHAQGYCETQAGGRSDVRVRVAAGRAPALDSESMTAAAIWSYRVCAS